jgi:hypothetical protein
MEWAFTLIATPLSLTSIPHPDRIPNNLNPASYPWLDAINTFKLGQELFQRNADSCYNFNTDCSFSPDPKSYLNPNPKQDTLNVFDRGQDLSQRN